MARRYTKHFLSNAVGYCQQCGGTLKGEGISVGLGNDCQMCIRCADEIVELMRSRTEGLSEATPTGKRSR